MSALIQLFGVVCAVVGGTWALGPWFLFAAGLALLVVPELLERTRPTAAAEPPMPEAVHRPRPSLPDPGVPERLRPRRRERRAS